MSIWHCSIPTPIVLTSYGKELKASIIWEKAASKDGGGGIGGGCGASPWPSCRSYALDFIRVWLPRGSWTLTLGSASVMFVKKMRQIFVTKHANGRPVWCLSRISSIVSTMCLQRQKGIRWIKAYKNLALSRTSSLRRAIGHRLCCTTLQEDDAKRKI
jgi:hypothetical protein